MSNREIISLVIASFIGATSVHAGTATVELQSKSLVMLPTDNNAGQLIFTSTDGKTTVPEHFTRDDGRLGVSWELKPLNNWTNYETDVVVIHRDAHPGTFTMDDVIGFGRTVFSFPPYDANENGILVAIEADMYTDGWFFGRTTIDQMAGPNYFNSNFDGFFTKGGQHYYGHWHVDMVDVPGDVGDDMETLGTIELLRATGTGEYNRAAKKPELRLALNQISFLGNHSYTGAVPIQVRSTDEIHLPSFRLRRDDGATLVSTPATLRRSGSQYSGDVSFNDGYPDTPWKDYVNWTIRITDANDADGDGIPDLTDLPPLRLLREPKDRTVREGKKANFRVAAAGRGRKTYQWYFNGEPIEGATKPVLLLRRITPENAGEYSVHVTGGGGGTAISRAAVLTVRSTTPPAAE